MELQGIKPKAENEVPETDVYHYYMSDDDDETYGKMYGPAPPGSQEGMICPNCKTVNPFGSEKCSRCSETLSEGFI